MIRLFHVSDLHFGAEDGAALDWFATIVHAEAPDAIVVTGDPTMRARGSTIATSATSGPIEIRRNGGGFRA